MKVKTERQQGLTTQQAERLKKEHGENQLTQGRRIHPLRLFTAQFKDVMVLILLAATVISVLLGDTGEALVIITIVILNAVLGFIQEFRTEKALDALREMAAPTANVIRDGQRRQIPARDLVPGDYLLLGTGDRIPADGCLESTHALSCDESMISGESVPVDKLADRQDKVYMGTVVTRGRGTAVVTATGMNTEMGRIAGMLNEIEEGPTPLQQKLDQMGRFIAAGCLIICAIISVTGMLRGESAFDMLLIGISLAVAAIPEGLPAIVTISLALAVGRILKRKALVRRLHAVETLGCANVICTDKTGTLTQNKMTVKEVYTDDGLLRLSGDGNSAAGEFTASDGRPIRPERDKQLTTLLEIAALCNNGELTEAPSLLRSRAGQFKVSGDPTETALLVMAAKGRVFAGRLPYTGVGEIPFDPERKMMSVVVQDRGGERRLMTKGAPDILLERCSHLVTSSGIMPMTAYQRDKILMVNGQMASAALRVLGFAYKPLPQGQTPAEHGMVFVGLAGMLDPPRPEAYRAVLDCRRAGIRTVMITGDHRNTACAIAKDLKIMTEGDEVITGKQLDAMSDQALSGMVEKTAVFARVSPEHKLRIVRSLKGKGHIVAMTGDGVNDAPAIKEADIGVAMGISGTDVSKEASSLVLLDDNFATLAAAVEEGRVIYRNIRKFIRYLMSCNIGEVVTMFAGMLMGMPVVLMPIQILLVNLVTDGLPAMALGVEPPDPDVMRQRPRGRGESVFAGGLLTSILFRGCLIGLTTLGVFTHFLMHYSSLNVARTGALLTLIATQLFHVFECKSEHKTLFEIHFFNNVKLILAVAASAAVSLMAVYLPAMQRLFMTAPLDRRQLITVLVFSLAAPVFSSILMVLRRMFVRPSRQEELR